MNDVRNIAFIFNGIWTTALLFGTYLASKSVYSRQNAKESAALIATLTQRTELLETDNEKLKEDMNKTIGELSSYRKMKTIDPEIIIKLTSTMESVANTSSEILKALKKDGIHVSIKGNK